MVNRASTSPARNCPSAMMYPHLHDFFTGMCYSLATRWWPTRVRGGHMELHVYFHCMADPSIAALTAKMDQVLALVQTIKTQEDVMSQELDDLTAQVHRTTDLEQSAITLIQG